MKVFLYFLKLNLTVYSTNYRLNDDDDSNKSQSDSTESERTIELDEYINNEDFNKDLELEELKPIDDLNENEKDFTILIWWNLAHP